MSSLTLHLVIDDQTTADPWKALIASYLRRTADQVLASAGPIEMAADWPNLEAWQQQPEGQQGTPVTVSANTAAALWAVLRTAGSDVAPPELVERLERAMRRAGWPPDPPEPRPGDPGWEAPF